MAVEILSFFLHCSKITLLFNFLMQIPKICSRVTCLDDRDFVYFFKKMSLEAFKNPSPLQSRQVECDVEKKSAPLGIMELTNRVKSFAEKPSRRNGALNFVAKRENLRVALPSQPTESVS